MCGLLYILGLGGGMCGLLYILGLGGGMCGLLYILGLGGLLCILLQSLDPGLHMLVDGGSGKFPAIKPTLSLLISSATSMPNIIINHKEAKTAAHAWQYIKWENCVLASNHIHLKFQEQKLSRTFDLIQLFKST